MPGSDNDNPTFDVEDQAVVIGDTTRRIFGTGAVVIGPTDGPGNLQIGGTVAVGSGAQAGPAPIAIGAGATASVGTSQEEENPRVVKTASEDRKFMELAIEEMRRSPGQPKVGAVVVDADGNVVGQGYRTESGVHAEQVALETSIGAAGPLTLYTTLEPCTGTKSDCASTIANSEVTTVVIGRYDLHPDIYRKGWERLAEAGLTLRDFDHDLRQRCDDVNSESVLNYATKVGPTGHGRFSYEANGAGGRLELRFSETDARSITVRFTARGEDSVYAAGSSGVSVALAKGASDFEEIDDPRAFGGFSHSAAIAIGQIAVYLNDEGAVLLQVTKVDKGSNSVNYKFEIVAFEPST